MGRKNGYKEKEWDEIQKLKAENKKLRTQVGKLRKVIKNIDIEHYQFVQDLLNSENFKDNPVKITKKELEKQWQCYECESGVMRLVTIHRVGEPYYFRKCDNCDNRTKMKKYTDEVQGV